MSKAAELREATNRIVAVALEAERRAQGTVVLTWAARLENLLQNLLIAAMRPTSQNQRDRLFEGYGPLSSFSAKIEIAYLFELIPKEIRDALTHIKNLRNRFAHSIEILHLDHPKVQPILQNILNPTDSEKRASVAFVEAIQPIDKYLVDRAAEVKKPGDIRKC